MFDFRPRLHVQISPELLTVRNLKSGQVVSEVPEAAIGGTPKKILAAGAQARLATAQAGVEVVNPFAHPRSLVSDFTTGYALLRIFVRRVLGRQWLQVSPLIFMQPLGDPAGGFTQIERRALREMALGAGASQVILCIPVAPPDREMLEMKVRTTFVAN